MAEKSRLTLSTAKTLGTLLGKDPRTVERHAGEPVAYLRTTKAVVALYDFAVVTDIQKKD
jgi:hypothetical protein